MSELVFKRHASRHTLRGERLSEQQSAVRHFPNFQLFFLWVSQ
jgi:hypothetical protein